MSKTEIRDTLEQTGVLDESTELIGVDSDFNINGSGVEMQAVEITAVQPYRAGQGTTRNETQKLLMEDGTQLKLEKRHRPLCPSCGYVPAGDDEPSHLLGQCRECRTKTCPSCNNKCESCGTNLCNDHTSGHGLKGKTLCQDCVGDVEEKIRFERKTINQRT